MGLVWEIAVSMQKLPRHGLFETFSQDHCILFVQKFTKKRGYCRKYNVKTGSCQNPTQTGEVRGYLGIKAVAYSAFRIEVLGMKRIYFDLLS
jgi:hypothetical protein